VVEVSQYEVGPASRVRLDITLLHRDIAEDGIEIDLDPFAAILVLDLVVGESEEQEVMDSVLVATYQFQIQAFLPTDLRIPCSSMRRTAWM